MPRHIVKRVPYLIKHHVRDCKNTGPGADLTQCDCQWSGKYKKRDYVLSKWANIKIDPHTVGAAKVVLTRYIAAIDHPDGIFDPAGERPEQKGGTMFKEFIDEWIEHYAKPHKLSLDSLEAQLGVIKDSPLGSIPLAQLAGENQRIGRWLNETADERKWTNKTWCSYHNLINRVCKYALHQEVNGRARMARNPMTFIAVRVFDQPEHFKQRHLIEDVEDRLFKACDQLDRPQHLPNRNKLTQPKADAIRAKVEKGVLQKTLAKEYGVSPAVISAIVHGQIWNPARYRVGTKGREMRRRLMAAFDLGLRRLEMLKIQVKDVDWRHPKKLTTPDGKKKFNGYVITLPPANTKAGKITGKAQHVRVGTYRLSKELEARHFQLGNKPEKYLFGTEEGDLQLSFKRMWHELFELAGLDYGRDKGLVWHTTRHEFTSRVVEEKGTRAGMVAARHANESTTQLYAHDRNETDWDVAVCLNRG